ncbi:MAG: acetate--CoA ligase family protein [Halobacteriales archaeon]
MTDSVLATARAEGRTALTEPEAKALLASASIDVPEYRVVHSPDAAVTAAEAIGYPVVGKVVAPSIEHKSDWRDGIGVATGLQDATAVRQACHRITEALEDAGRDGQLLVEASVDLADGTELLLGGTREAAFGPTVTLGLGGIYAEVFEDVAHRLAPLEASEARGMLEEFAGARLLAGVRGKAPADTDAVVDAVVAVGRLLAEEPAIAEVDINPLFASADGATALDALIVLDDAA